MFYSFDGRQKMKKAPTRVCRAVLGVSSEQKGYFISSRQA